MSKKDYLKTNIDNSRNNISLFKKGAVIVASNGYTYSLSNDYGKQIDKRMKYALKPIDMLKRGVFSGKYLNDDVKEFPKIWFSKSFNKLSPDFPDSNTNEFKIKSRMSLKHWKLKNWIIKPDDKGWFQWYCRYFIGRRLPNIDEKQIKRWVSYKRHASQLRNAAFRENRVGDPSFRKKQRQSLLQWAWNQYYDIM